MRSRNLGFCNTVAKIHHKLLAEYVRIHADLAANHEILFFLGEISHLLDGADSNPEVPAVYGCIEYFRLLSAFYSFLAHGLSSTMEHSQGPFRVR